MEKEFNKKLSFPKIKSHETPKSTKREIKVDAKKTGYIITGFTTLFSTSPFMFDKL